MGVFRRKANWFIDFYAYGRRIREKVGSSKGEALRALTVRKAAVALGKFDLIPRASIPTFKELADKYEQLISIHKKGRAGEHYIISMFVGVFGKMRIDGLTAQDAEKFKGARCRQVKPGTVNREMTVLKHMMSQALEWKHLARNPFKGIKPLVVADNIERILELDEEIRLLAACDRIRSRFLRPAVLLALNTGMRRGELLSLQWTQADLTKRTIRVISGKTKSSKRTIPMNSTVQNLLSDLKKAKSSELIFPSNRNPGDRIVDLKKGFKKAVRLANLSTNLRFHDLRHTFATRLVDGGANIVTVQRLLGHARISMTARYAHSPDATRVAAVEKLDELFSSKSGPQLAPRAIVRGQGELLKSLQANSLGS